MLLQIRKIGDPILHEICIPMSHDLITSEETFWLVMDMGETMRANGGIGLAANQVGLLNCLITLKIGDSLIAMANPKIISAKNWKFGTESCLSIPGKEYKTERATKIVVEFFDLNGAAKKITVDDDVIARVIQHEIDHLSGILICDSGELIK